MTAPYIPPRKSTGESLAQALLASPTADSLWSLSSNGRPATAVSRLLSMGNAGTYRPLFDLVTINPDGNADREEMRTTLIHEAGHRARNLGLALGRNVPYRLPKTANATDSASVDSYYNKNPREGYAQAFTNAYRAATEAPRVLRESPSMTRQEFLSLVGKMEAKTPGAGEILRDLIWESPVFNDHPYRSFIPKR